MCRAAWPAYTHGRGIYGAPPAHGPGSPRYDDVVQSFLANFAFAACLTILSGSLGLALGRHYCACSRPELPTSLSGGEEILVPASAFSGLPLAAAPEPAWPIRGLDRDSVSLSRIAEMEQENATLRAKVAQLEANLLPTTQAQMAIAIGQPEDVVRHALGRTQILNDAAILAETLRAIGAQRTWDALQAEAQFYRTNVQFRALNGEPNGEATWEERIQWHRNVWVPHMTTSVATFCDQLYRLGLPSPAIESFRKRMEEGL